jgi:hypothetical protein
MLERQPGIAYRFCPAEAAQARELNRQQHASFVAWFGGDLATYPDALAFAAEEQKRLEASWRTAEPEQVRRMMRERGLDKPRPSMRFPRDFLDHDQGIGVFYNPDEGQEIMPSFNHVLSGLRKQGAGLSELEPEALRHFITHEVVSPAFVRRLVRDHGAASLLEVFHLREMPPERALSFLLRCHKGAFYRHRYPTLGFARGG